MTKEEFLMLRVGAPIPLVNGVRATFHIEKAMDEYAKQQAIAFDKWKLENGWAKEYGHVSMYIKSVFVEGHGFKYERSMFDDLYNQFIEQQNKDGK